MIYSPESLTAAELSEFTHFAANLRNGYTIIRHDDTQGEFTHPISQYESKKLPSTLDNLTHMR